MDGAARRRSGRIGGVGGRTLVLWERGFGFERWVTVVSGEFGDFQFLLISQDYSRSRDP